MNRKAAVNRDRANALDKELRAMFRALQGRRVPERLRSTVDQLNEIGLPRAGWS